MAVDKRRLEEYAQATDAARGFDRQVRRTARRRLGRTAATFAVFLVPTLAFAALCLDVQERVSPIVVFGLTAAAGPHLCSMWIFGDLGEMRPTLAMVLSAVLVTLTIMKLIADAHFDRIALLVVAWVFCSGLAMLYALAEMAPLKALAAAL